MKQQHSVAVIGGTGKAGKYIVQQLIHAGYNLKLLLRNPAQFDRQHPQIRVIIGDAREPLAIQELMTGCVAIISAIGQPKGEPSVFSTVSRNIVKVMNYLKIRRYIALTGVNVDTAGDRKTGYAKVATEWMKINYPLTTADKQLEWEELCKTTVDWTLVRLPMIQLTDIRNETKTSLTDCRGEHISATSLALFIVEQLGDDAFYQQAPFIFNR